MTFYAAESKHGKCAASSLNWTAWNVYSFETKAERSKWIDEDAYTVAGNVQRWTITAEDYKAVRKHQQSIDDARLNY